MNEFESFLINLLAITIGMVIILFVLTILGVIFFGLGYLIGVGINIVFGLHNETLPIILGVLTVTCGLFFAK